MTASVPSSHPTHDGDIELVPGPRNTSRAEMLPVIIVNLDTHAVATSTGCSIPDLCGGQPVGWVSAKYPALRSIQTSKGLIRLPNRRTRKSAFLRPRPAKLASTGSTRRLIVRVAGWFVLAVSEMRTETGDLLPLAAKAYQK